MVVKVSDASGEAFLSVFNEQAEKIIGCTADELNELRSQVSTHATQTYECINVCTNFLSLIFLGWRQRVPNETEGSIMGTPPFPSKRNYK